MTPAPDTSATVELWRRLHRPFSPAGAIEALTGMSPVASRQVAGLGLATSAEVDRLLGGMHEIVRSLAIATTSKPLRSVGEVRGPIMWSETIAARSASPGAADVYICAAPQKAYDTEENRVLVHALLRIREAARDADATEDRAHEPADQLRVARHNGTRASRALEHRTLASVSHTRPDGRGVRKARSSAKARSYQAAIDVLTRAGEPVDADVVAAHAGERARRQHALLLALHDRLVATGHAPSELRVEAGTLRAGPLRYVPRHRADTEGLHGIVVGSLLVDFPDDDSGDALAAEAALVERAAGHPALLITRPGDVDRAVQLAAL